MRRDADLPAVLEDRHVEHLGMYPVQMCFPNGTSSRLISIQYLRGSFRSSARIVSSGDRVATYPHRLVTRWTWMATLMCSGPASHARR